VARVSGSKDYISMALGLITEASPLAAPEGSTFDEQNFVLDMNQGIRKRRKGYANPVSDFSKTVPGSTASRVLDTVYWRQENIYVAVLTFEGTQETWLRFHSNDASFTFLDEFRIAFQTTVSVFVSEVRGGLVLTGNGTVSPLEPLFIERLSTGTGNIYGVDLFIRDFELLEDSLSVSERPSTLSDEHRYNLLNAGWYAERRLESSGSLGDPIADFFSETGEYPSNADVAQLGLKTDSDGNEEFSPDTLVEISVGNSEASRGHYVYDIEDFERNDRLTDPTEDGTVDSSLTLLGTVTL